MAIDPRVKHQQMMQEIVPSMRWQEGEDVAAWQEKARAKLREVLGLPFASKAENFRIEWTKEDDPKWNEIRFAFESEPGQDVVCHLVLPKAYEGKLPLAICMQGHGTGMHISLGRVKFPGDEGDFDGDRDFAVQAVAKGFAALAIEQRAMGEGSPNANGSPNCNHPAYQAILLGRTIIGERCHDVSCTIDVVEQHFPMIGMERIFMTGNSGGGTTTIYATALDTRIKAAMPSCALCGYYASIGAMQHCPCNYIPGIMKYFDMADLVAMAAPRPYVAVNGVTDASFPIESAKQQVSDARKVYAALGAEDKLRHVIGPEGHRFYKALAWPVFDEITGW